MTGHVSDIEHLVLTDDYGPGANSRGIRGLVKRLLLDRCAARLVRESRNPDTLILTGMGTASVLRANGLKVLEYSSGLVERLENGDFEAIHDFADALFDVCTEGGKELGLIQGQAPVLKLLEINWIEPLYTRLLYYAQAVSDSLDTYPISRLSVGSSQSDVERIGLACARSLGLATSSADYGYARLLSFLMGPRWPQTREGLREATDHCVDVFSSGLSSGSSRSGRPRVICLARMDRSVARLESVLGNTTVLEEFDLHVVADRRVSLVQSLGSLGASCTYYGDWLNRREARQIVRSNRARLRDGWRYIDRRSSRFPHQYQGVTIYPYARKLLRIVTEESGPAAAVECEMARRVMTKLEPSLVVNFEDASANRAMAYAAQEKGIPVLGYYPLSPAKYAGLLRRSPDWLAVPGGSLANSYAGGAHTFNKYSGEDRLRIVGDTLTDRKVSRSPTEIRRRVRHDLGLDQDRFLLALVTRPAIYPAQPESSIEQMFLRTFRAVRAIPGLQVIVKAHPLQSVAELKSMMSKLGCEACVVQNTGLLEVCAASDLVSIAITSAVWEAMLAPTPIVSVVPDRYVDAQASFYGYREGGGVVHIGEDEDPTPVFEALLFDKDARACQLERAAAHVQEHVGPLDGRASQRFHDLLTEILTTSAQKAPA